MYLFDGAMGTQLQKYGLTSGCPDYFNISHPDIVQKIHRDYVQAGSHFITTNTFGNTALKLMDYGLEDQVEAIAEAAVKNARAAGGDKIEVAGDIGPTGKFIVPMGNLSFEEAYDNFARSAKALEKAGADYLIIETVIDIQEMRAALLACKTETNLPVICSMTYTEDGRSITGTDPVTAAVLLDSMGADVIAANCSVGPDKLLEVAKKMMSVTNKPILIQPNAGLPVLKDGVTTYPLDPEGFNQWTKDYVAAGVTYLGGCCGTTPEHIRVMHDIVESLPEGHREKVKPFTAFTSRTKTVFVGDDYAPIAIGERINPTGRKNLKEAIKSGQYAPIKKEALSQIKAGADMLDVNVGVPGMDQTKVIKDVVSELSVLSQAPLSIDSTDPKVLEEALRIYPGRALVNSVNAHDEESMDKIFTLAKKYGAGVLCLPLAKGGLPKTPEERAAIIRVILRKAKEHHLRKEDLLLDPLVLTAGSGTKSGKSTLDTIRLYKEEFGLPCVMGTSNISFGLPNRPQLNASFLTMALCLGMNAPIVNPLDQEIKDAFIDADLLLGFDPGAKQYIQLASPQKHEAKESHYANPMERLQHAVLDGEKEEAADALKECVAAKIPAADIIKNALTKAMKEIGDGYGAGKVYLPQVMMSAEAMQAAFTEMKKLLPDLKSQNKGTFVIGTVEGDIHELGKNIVAALMENNGYTVVDLGKDVPPAKFVEAVKEHHASLCGLCSLMTTTLSHLKETVALLKKEIPSVKIMVGGAVVTQEYADSIGADSYAKDGIIAVKKADELTQNQL